MNVKALFSKILASILGIIIIGSIVNPCLVFILTILFIAVRLEFWVINLLIWLLNIIAGIYVGLRAYKNKNVWYVVFKPTKSKALISLILSTILVILAVMFFGKETFVSAYTFKPISLVLAVPLAIFSYVIAFYPFSALCNFIYNYKKDKLFKKSKAIIIVLLILLNPIFIVLGGTIGALYNYSTMNEPCGVRIVAFNEPSAAKDAGMQTDEIIVRINDEEVKSLADFIEYMDAYDPSIGLFLYTKSGSYNVKPVLVGGRYLLGINVTQELCARSLNK